MHVHNMMLRDNNSVVPQMRVLLYDRIYQECKPGIYHVYSSRRSLVCADRFVAHPHLEASDRDFLQLATESLPTQGWGRSKFHSQVLQHLVDIHGCNIVINFRHAPKRYK